MTIKLYILDASDVDAALAFNAELPEGFAVQPIAVLAPAPYPYAGKFVLPAVLGTSTYYAVMWNYLAGFPTADIVIDEAWPDNDE